MIESSGSKRLSAEEKLKLVLGSYQSENIAEYCRVQNVDRSYLYQLRREHEAMALAGWEERRVGRPPKTESADDAETLREELERARKEAAAAREEAMKWEVRSEIQGFYLRVAEGDLKKKDDLPNRAARRRAKRKGGSQDSWRG